MFDLDVRLNDQMLPSAKPIDSPEQTTLQYHNLPVRQAQNPISISLKEQNRSDSLRIEGIELVITYKQ